MTGNFRCESCLGMFAALSPVGHEWHCSGCISKAAGVGRELGGASAQPGPFIGPSLDSKTAPVAAEASEYGWPRKGETYHYASHPQFVYEIGADTSEGNPHGFGPNGANRAADRPSAWLKTSENGHVDYRRISSPSVASGNPASPTEPAPSFASASSVAVERAGEMSDDAIWRRWADVAIKGGSTPKEQLLAFVRSEAERAAKGLLTREQVDDAWDAAQLQRGFQHAVFMGCIDAELKGDP